MGIKSLQLVLVGLVIMLQYCLWFADAGLFQTLRLKRAIASQQVKNEELIREHQQVAAEIKALRHGGSAIENRARNDLGMVKKDEVFYHIVE